ncbi:hypothetical protein [Vibrio metschnikovii]|nr:hypothetical protein [Vibrio metschnikovii]
MSDDYISIKDRMKSHAAGIIITMFLVFLVTKGADLIAVVVQ